MTVMSCSRGLYIFIFFQKFVAQDQTGLLRAASVKIDAQLPMKFLIEIIIIIIIIIKRVFLSIFPFYDLDCPSAAAHLLP